MMTQKEAEFLSHVAQSEFAPPGDGFPFEVALYTDTLRPAGWSGAAFGGMLRNLARKRVISRGMVAGRSYVVFHAQPLVMEWILTRAGAF